jgi:hypothetical protein
MLLRHRVSSQLAFVETSLEMFIDEFVRCGSF